MASGSLPRSSRRHSKFHLLVFTNVDLGQRSHLEAGQKLENFAKKAAYGPKLLAKNAAGAQNYTIWTERKTEWLKVHEN